MNFVKSFNIGGVDASQIPCIKGSGAPNSAIEGAVGCLYMDTDTGDMYKCTAAADGTYTWEKFGGSTGDIEGFPAFKKIGGEEYNEITKAIHAAVFNTAEDFMAHNGNAILNHYAVYKDGVEATDTDAEKTSCVLKLPVNPGDIIRDKLATFWQMPGFKSGTHYIHFYNESNTAIEKVLLRWADNTDAAATANYLDIRNNGVVAPEGSAYALITVRNRYKLNSNSDVYNGVLANIITVNKDASKTKYDGVSAAADYIPVQSSGEVYYNAVDDIRIARYEKALGDIGTALDSIIADQKGLIGGDAE